MRYISSLSRAPDDAAIDRLVLASQVILIRLVAPQEIDAVVAGLDGVAQAERLPTRRHAQKQGSKLAGLAQLPYTFLERDAYRSYHGPSGKPNLDWTE